MSYEVLLQFFIGVVDAQLLKVIDAKALKAVHVQNACKWERLIKASQTSTTVKTGLPMKFVHADASARMLLLMKVTSHSNSLSGEDNYGQPMENAHNMEL